jgi:hypothetical protein
MIRIDGHLIPVAAEDFASQALKPARVLCDDCGDENCSAYRARERNREPFLPPAFELGAQWYSYDDGLTWSRFPTAEQISDYVQRRGHVNRLTVTAINYDRGEVVMGVSK